MKKTTEKAFLDKAHKQFQTDVEQEKDIRAAAELDVDFRAGTQWDEKIKADRIAEGRPALSFPKVHIFIASIANEARQTRPQPKVNPIGGGSTTDTATVINGILRHIQSRSQADVASDTALDHAVGSSFGYIRAVTEYVPKSLDQEIRILTVVDQFSIYGVLIPALRRQTCRHAFVKTVMSREEYEAKHGQGKPIDWEGQEWDDAGPNWLNGEDVTVAEYWRIEDVKKTLRAYTGEDGNPVGIYTDEAAYRPDLPFLVDEKGEPLERVEHVQRVYSSLIDGVHELPNTKTEWLGDTIPIVAVLGQQLTVKGKHHLFSLIRHVHDAQCMINLYQSSIAEKMGLMNRVPLKGYTGQFTDPKLLDCNVKNYPFLEFDPVVLPDGSIAPIPQQQQLEEQIGALSGALAMHIEALKSGMGIQDASLGNRSNETSGIGIARRQAQASTINYHFNDNLNRALWDLFSKLLKVIAKVYSRPGRQVRIVGEDEAHSVVVVNQKYKDEETGKEKFYPLDVGEYDVVVKVGPSNETARLEGADTLGEFFKAVPAAVPILGDLWVGSMDFPWAREGARRLKAAAPQNIVNEPEKGALKIPPQVQQQLEQSGEMIKQLTATVHQQAQEIETKKAELDSRERVVALQEETKREIALAELGADGATELLRADLLRLQQQYEQLHELMMAAQAQGHEAGMQGADQDHQAGMQGAAQEHAAGIQDAAQSHEAEQASEARDAAAEQLPKAA